MNKKLLILLILIAIAAYYLDQEEKRKLKTLLTSEPWIIPQTIPSQTKAITPVDTSPNFKEPIIKSPVMNQLLNRNRLQLTHGWQSQIHFEELNSYAKEALTRQNQTQRKFHLRTDLANIYNCFYKAKTKIEIYRNFYKN